MQFATDNFLTGDGGNKNQTGEIKFLRLLLIKEKNLALKALIAIFLGIKTDIEWGYPLRQQQYIS